SLGYSQGSGQQHSHRRWIGQQSDSGRTRPGGSAATAGAAAAPTAGAAGLAELAGYGKQHASGRLPISYRDACALAIPVDSVTRPVDGRAKKVVFAMPRLARPAGLNACRRRYRPSGDARRADARRADARSSGGTRSPPSQTPPQTLKNWPTRLLANPQLWATF